MQVVIFKNIEKLGMQGDVVKVAPGYFRNYLRPRGLAVEASQPNLKRLQLKRKRLQAEAENQLNAAEAVANRLADAEIRFVRKATEKDKLFGSIHDHDILEKLTEAGFTLERRQLVLREPIKTVGIHTVHIRLLGRVGADIKVIVEAEGGPKKSQADPEAAQTASAEPAQPEAVKTEEAQSEGTEQT